MAAMDQRKTDTLVLAGCVLNGRACVREGRQAWQHEAYGYAGSGVEVWLEGRLAVAPGRRVERA